jgi:hypothetical protein
MGASDEPENSATKVPLEKHNQHTQGQLHHPHRKLQDRILEIAPSDTYSEEPPATVRNQGATPPRPGCRKPRHPSVETAAINPTVDCAAKTLSWPPDLAASVKSGENGGRGRARVEKERPVPSQDRGARARRQWPAATSRPWAASPAACLHVEEVGN